MSTIKTTANDMSAEDFIQTVDDVTKRQDSFALLELYKEITGEPPKMWGSSIIGFGTYHYKSSRSSQEGDWPLVAFSPRKQSLTLYFMPGFDNYTDLLDALGSYTTSKSCLYIKKLADIDRVVLENLIRRAYTDMCQMYR